MANSIRSIVAVRDCIALRNLIFEQGYSARQFAGRIGIHPATMGHILARYRNPSPSTAKKIANALHVPFRELFEVRVGGAGGENGVDSDSVRSLASQ